MNQLDHLIVFLPGPNEVELLFPAAGGLLLDPGTRHVGQGTRNRRVIFDNCYVELLWVDSPVDAKASGLRFEDRCAGRACPFGVVLRGRVPAAGFTEYIVPGGPTLKILDDPHLPFIGVYEADDPERSPQMRRQRREYLNDAEVLHAQISNARQATEIEVSGLAFVVGEPQMTLTLTGVQGQLRLTPGEEWSRS
jgi:hypothetical protein